MTHLVEQGLAGWDLKLVEALPGEHDPAWSDVRVVDLMQHRAVGKVCIDLGAAEARL